MRTRYVLCVVTTLLATPACDDSTPSVDLDTDTEMDVQDTQQEPDVEVEWGMECEDSEDCDDRVDCTVDECIFGRCENTPDDTLCDDGLQCNGDEICHMRDGCKAGDTFMGCYDEDPCTMDVCVEGAPGMSYTCTHPPLDRDGDEHVDDHCGGDDCNDMNPDVYPGSGELCFDEKDNDCDDLIDAEDAVDCALDNDTCETPDVMTFEETTDGLRATAEGFTMEAAGDIESGCDPNSYADVAFQFTLDDAADVQLQVVGRDGYYPYGAVQAECGNPDTRLFCKASSPLKTCLPGLDAGTYYVIVSSWEEGIFDVRVDATDPAGPLPGDDCTDAVDVSAGGTFDADLFCAADDYTTSCASWGTYNDLIYTFTLDEPQDVHIRAFSPISYVYVSLTTECADSTTTIDCDSDYPFDRTYGALGAGTYYILLEAYTPTEYTLEVDFGPPSDPPANDTCASAVDVSAGGTFHGSLVSASDDGDISCRSSGYLDAAYTFTIDEVLDVDIEVDGEGSYEAYFGLQTECGNQSTDIGCVDSSPARKLFRSMDPGTYYILVESSYEGEYDLDVSFSAPTSACDGAAVIDAPGTVSGDNTGLLDDFVPPSACSGGGDGPDVPYILRLAEDSNVAVEVTASDFDPILMLRSICDDPASVLVCDDDAISGYYSRIETADLPAGDYYLILDSYYSWGDGTYTLQVDITPTSMDVADVPDRADMVDALDAPDE